MWDQTQKLKMNIMYHDMGIVPIGAEIGGAKLEHDMNRVLAQLPRDEARKLKRKFRKVWRGIVKAGLRHGGKSAMRSATKMGFQVQEPKRIHKNARKWAVKGSVSKKMWDSVKSPSMW
jgi:hypothetical protein